MNKELMAVYSVPTHVLFTCEDMKWTLVFVALFFHCVPVIFTEGEANKMIFSKCLSKFCCDS